MVGPWVVRRGERRLTVALAGYFFLLMAALYLMKPARNALFLEDLGADNLPWVYIATALVTWWVVVAYVRATRVARLHRLIGITLLGTLACVVGFSVWLAGEARAGTMLFYVWVKVYAVLLPSQFWLLSEEVLNPRQARRLFGPIGAGGVLGGICGSAMAAAVARGLGAIYLLPGAALAILAAWLLFHFLLSRLPARGTHPAVRDDTPYEATETEDPDRHPGREETQAAPHGRSLVITIAAILMISTTAHTIVDWQFNKAAEAIADADGRAAFFGGFFTVLNIVTLIIQMTATSFVLGWFGIGAALALLPAALAVGAVGILVHPRLWTVSLARGADDALRLSVDQSGRELLFLPFTSAERQRLKPRIDLIASRLANGIAGVLILAAVWWLADPLRSLSAVVLVLAVVWGALVVRARGQYAHTLQHLLRVRDLDIGTLASSRLDATASSAIRDGLASGDDDTALAALALAEHTEPTAFVEELRELLRKTDNDALRSHALHLLSGAEDGASVDDAIARLDRDPVASIPEVLAYACTTRDPEARERILQYLDSRNVHLEPEILRPTLTTLLHDEDPHVVRGALAACARFPDDELVGEICEIGTRRSTQGAALLALQGFGGHAIGALTGLLAHPRNGRARRSFAARALGRVGGREAAGGLIAGLVAEDRKVRRATLKALNYMRRRGEHLDIGRDREAAAIGIEWRDYLRLQRVAAALGEPGTGSAMAFVATVVNERLWEAEEQLFRALALRHPIQAVFFAYRGLITGDAAARSHAIELVDSVVETPERRTLVRLLEAPDRTSRGQIAAQELGHPIPTAVEALHELLDPGDPWLAACAIRALEGGAGAVPRGLQQELQAHRYAPLDELLT